MRAIETEGRLAVLASGQWGLVTAPQAVGEGVSYSQLNRLADQEVITRLTHGVYRLRSAPLDPHLDLRAAWLALDPKRTVGQRLKNPTTDAVVSHASAARFRGWGDLTAYDHEFTYDGRKQSRRVGVRFHRGATPAVEVEIVDGLPVVTAERLVGDLLADDYDFDHIGAVLAGAVRDRAVDLGALSTHLAAFAVRRGFEPLDGASLVAALVQSGGAQPHAAASNLIALAQRNPRAMAGLADVLHKLSNEVPRLDADRVAVAEITAVLRQLAGANPRTESGPPAETPPK